MSQIMPDHYTLGYDAATGDNYCLLHADCLEWLSKLPDNTLHAIVTDPPYGIKEYDPEQLQKRKTGTGGTWRIPPNFDGHTRAPLPRFTALSQKELQSLTAFYRAWSEQVARVLRPGGHLILASNAYLSQLVFAAIVHDALEFRGEIIRLVRTLRGGDRPKNAEQEFSEVCSLPRGSYEPWGLFRKPMPRGMTVSECLRTYQTGGLRRNPDGNPFSDVIDSTRTPKQERAIANHPSLKPQAFMRQLVYAALPLGEGLVVDPFMGSGATIAAAHALGYHAIGVERHAAYYQMSTVAVPQLAALATEFDLPSQLSLWGD